jgi:hypothetical protein
MIIGCCLPALVQAAALPRILPAPATPPAIPDAVVAHITFRSFTELQQLTAQLDVWEVHHTNRAGQGEIVALLPHTLVPKLTAAGYSVEVDPLRTALLRWRPLLAAEQTAGIPGFPCYRTVEETYDALQLLEIDHPALAQWVDIGDSWDKTDDGGAAGYDLQAIVLTNRARTEPKPVFFLMAAIHAREYVTAELATRFAELLVNQYGSDADVTWLLDHTEIHIVAQANPDGRKRAEEIVLWRKNTNHDECPNETPSFSYYGVDLNRNSTFKWNGCEGFGCSSDNVCIDTYRGVAPASEPETQALEAYMRTLFADRRGPADTDIAPADTTGLMISLHSYSELVLFPWGWRATPSPNAQALETLGRKFGYFTGYEVCQAGEPGCIYQTDGSTDDWAYGELGVAAYTFEMGTEFFQQCTTFEETMVDDTMATLLYAAKSAPAPYQLPAGPETVAISTTITNVIPLTDTVPITTLVAALAPTTPLTVSPVITGLGPILQISAIADDTRYASNGWGVEPTQPISATRLLISSTGWPTATDSYLMNATDGAFDSAEEAVALRLQLSTAPAMRYYLLLQSQDRAGNWGVPTAAFVDTAPPTGVIEEDEPAKTYYLPLIQR